MKCAFITPSGFVARIIHLSRDAAARQNKRKVETHYDAERPEDRDHREQSHPRDRHRFPRSQVAILTERISQLTAHLKVHPHDFHSRRGMQMMIGKRRRLLDYLAKKDIERYRALIAKLGLRK